jgi:hypothetical protein
MTTIAELLSIPIIFGVASFLWSRRGVRLEGVDQAVGGAKRAWWRLLKGLGILYGIDAVLFGISFLPGDHGHPPFIIVPMIGAMAIPFLLIPFVVWVWVRHMVAYWYWERGQAARKAHQEGRQRLRFDGRSI